MNLVAKLNEMVQEDQGSTMRTEEPEHQRNLLRAVGTDGVGLDVIKVGTWMLCGGGRSLSGRYHGWHLGALWERTEFV